MNKFSKYAPFLALILSFGFCSIIFWQAESYSKAWIGKNGDPLDQALSILEAHGDLGWRQKQNLNTVFLGDKIVTNKFGFRAKEFKDKKPNVLRIVALGPSSTFGWGVESSETYSDLLQLELRRKFQINSEVINLGQIGYSSYQGRKLADRPEILSLDPDILLLAYGVNDVDRVRFFFDSDLTDKEQFLSVDTFFVQAQNILNQFFVNRLILRKLGEYFSLNFCNPKFYQPKMRVSRSEFIENMDYIRGKFKPRTKVILLSTDHTFYNLSIGEKYQNKKLYGDAEKAAKAGRCSEAKEKFSLARNSEPKRIAGSVIEYNRELLAYAKDKSLHLINIESLFGGLTWEEKKQKFVDPVHFSKSGHRRISQEIAKIINNSHANLSQWRITQ